MKRKRYSEPARKYDERGTVLYTVTVEDGGKPKRVKRRGYPGWYLREYDPATRRQRWIYGGESVEDARKLRDNLEERALRGEADAVETAFDTAADAFLEWKRSELAGAAAGPLPEDYKQEPTAWLQELHRRLGTFKETFGEKLVSQITARDLERYFAKRGGGPKTKTEDLRILKSFFRWARRHRYTRNDPSEDLRPWKSPRREARSLSREEEARLLEACVKPYTVNGIRGNRNIGGRNGAVSAGARESWSQTFTPPPWLRPLVLLALRTALRLGNLLHLEWRHVDLKRGHLRIPAEELKNNADLELPLHPEARKLLEDLRREAVARNPVASRVLAVASAPPATGSGRRTVARVFASAAARAGLPEGFVFHGLRKVAATRMLQGGADIRTVMAVGGWTDPTTLLKHYAAATAEAKVAAVAKL